MNWIPAVPTFDDSHLVEVFSDLVLGTANELSDMIDSAHLPIRIEVDHIHWLLAENGIGRCQNCDKWWRVSASPDYCDDCIKGDGNNDESNR